MRPKSIELFEKVYWGGTLLGLVIAVLNWENVTATLNTPEAKSLGMGSGFLIGTIVVNFFISVLVWYFVARRASNVAKWVYVAITAIALFMMLSTLANPSTASGLPLAGNLVAIGLQLYCAWLLFRPDAVAWLESKGVNGPGDPGTFD